jgi:hypothetical protein
MHLIEQWLHTPWQLKMYTKLASLQYKILYKHSSSNQAAMLYLGTPLRPCSSMPFHIQPHNGLLMFLLATLLIQRQ